MEIIALNAFEIERKKRKRVGRGIGSGKGTTSGAGDKGQSARSGTSFSRRHSVFIRRLPKLGFRSQFVKLKTVTLKNLQDAIKQNPVSKVFEFAGKKLIGGGECAENISGLEIKVAAISHQCKDYIESKGGKVICESRSK